MRGETFWLLVSEVSQIHHNYCWWGHNGDVLLRWSVTQPSEDIKKAYLSTSPYTSTMYTACCPFTHHTALTCRRTYQITTVFEVALIIWALPSHPTWKDHMTYCSWKGNIEAACYCFRMSHEFNTPSALPRFYARLMYCNLSDVHCPTITLPC